MRAWNRILVLAVASGIALTAQTSQAVMLTAKGGGSYLMGDGNVGLKKFAPLFGGELTFGLGNTFQIGGFYDHGIGTVDGFDISVTSQFFGAVVRVSPPGFALFADAQIGASRQSISGVNTDLAFSLGGGVGTIISIVPMVSLKPRIGYRYLPVKAAGTTTSASSVDAALLLSIALF